MPAAPRSVRYGALDCLVFDFEQGDGANRSGTPTAVSPTVAVVLCHGYGAPGHDLAGLAPEWIRILGEDASRVRFIFPAAPHDLAELGMPGGRAWWPINMAQLAAAIERSGDLGELHDQQPPGLDAARALLCEAIGAVQADMAGEQTRLVLGGFSQGAMLTMDTSLRGDIHPPDLLLQFSGTLICRPQWQAALPRLSKTFVYQTHGTLDSILPFASARRLHQLLLGAEISTEFHAFDGPHTIDLESILTAARSIQGLAKNG